MASWEDGPEYAPHERPQYYADAPVAPLEQAPPVAQPASGLPSVRPWFDSPSAPVAPLDTLVPAPPDERDPNRPFDVVTATLTTESAWGSPASTGSFVATAPMTTNAMVAGPRSWSAPAATEPDSFPPRPTAPPSEDPYGYPTPGTPGWFAPPPTSYGEQRTPGRVDAKQVVEAATPGLCVCLAIGGIIYPIAPVMLVVAAFLSSRVQVAKRSVRIAFRIAAGAVGFFAVIGLVRSVVNGDPWWDFVGLWSLVICWVMLAALLGLVWRGLVRPAPPDPGPWG